MVNNQHKKEDRKWAAMGEDFSSDGSNRKYARFIIRI